MKFNILFATLLLMNCVSSLAQLAHTEKLSGDTAANRNKHSMAGRNREMLLTVALPAAGLAYGFVKLGSHGLSDLDLKARYEFSIEHPHKKFTVDDYLQFAPGAAVFVASGLGVKGENRFIDQAGTYMVSNLILNVFCQSVKRITAVDRPDGTPNAFPSGHAAEAFASAEFLRREYGRQSVWYGIGGYASAFTVAYLRMYNNRHWLSDVVAGAGVGVLSTKASYWLYPKIKKLIAKDRNNSSTVYYPSYSHGTYGLTMAKVF